MQTTLIIVLLAIVFLLAWVRFSPTDTDDWHRDPGDVEDPGSTGIRLIGREAPRGRE